MSYRHLLTAVLVGLLIGAPLPAAADIVVSNGVYSATLRSTNPGAIGEQQVVTIGDPTSASTFQKVSGGGGAYVNLRNDSGTEVGTAGAPVRIDPTGTTTQPVSGSVSISGTPVFTFGDTVGADTTLDGLNDVASVATAGQQAAFIRVPSGGTFAGTIKPVICLRPVASCTAAADWLEDLAIFIGNSGGGGITTASAIATTDPNEEVEAQIFSAVPASAMGVKVTAFTSGSVSPVKVFAVSYRATTLIAGLQGGLIVPLPIIDNAGTKAVAVQNVEVQSVWGANRSAELLIDAVNETVVVAGAGAGGITFSVPTGLTGELRFEARMGTGTWFGTPVVFDDNTRLAAGVSLSSFPKQGHFEQPGYTEYRIRAHVFTSGSVTPRLEVSLGTSLVRLPPGGLSVSGDVAHDAADSGNPVKVGARATTSLSSPTPVANNDRSDLFTDADGALLVRPYANLADRVHPVPTAITDGSSTSVVAAQGAGIRFCAATITVSNSSATFVNVDIRDGTAGAVLHTIPAPATAGATVSFPVNFCTSANTAMAADPSAAATTITVSAVGVKTKL